MRIGFIGLGAMGAPIAHRIAGLGHEMAVFDLDGDRATPFVSNGARLASSPADCARGAEVVFAMVPDAPDSLGVALGENGVSDAIDAGSLYVDMSTIDPVTTRTIGEALLARGVDMIDCPVGRTTDHAARGELVLMVGGEAQNVDRIRTILEHLGDTIIHCGPLGAGTATKLVNNYVAMACNAVSAEAFVLGAKAGLTIEHMLHVFGSTMASNAQALKVFPNGALIGRTEPGFMVSLGHKDVRLALKMAEDFGCNAQIGRATLAVMGAAIEAGRGAEDCSSLLMLHEEKAGVKARLDSQ